jgi:hypothetical protein
VVCWPRALALLQRRSMAATAPGMAKGRGGRARAGATSLGRAGRREVRESPAIGSRGTRDGPVSWLNGQDTREDRYRTGKIACSHNPTARGLAGDVAFCYARF